MSKNFLINVVRRVEAAHGEGGVCVITTYLNPYSYLVLRKSRPDLAAIDRVYCDGILLAMLIRLAGVRTRRFSFDMTSMAHKVFAEAESHGRRLYFVGAEPGVAPRAAMHFQAEYPDLTIVGVESGFFDSVEHRRRVIDGIVEASPDICVVGMGTPLQEDFLVELKQAGWHGEGHTCGGFFHQTAKGGTAYYPPWMDRLHMRWLYRMFDEPKLIKRYFLLYPLFLGVFTKDVVSFWLTRGRLSLHDR